MTPRRQVWWAVLGAAAGAASGLYAVGRTWAAETVARPDPLPDHVIEHTGGDLYPWLVALGWVALAGAGALVAVGGAVRRALGGLLVLGGVAAVGGGVTAVVDPGVTSGWPVLAAVGGAAVAVAGGVTVCWSPRWPVMGARFERGGARAGGVGADPGADAGSGDPVDRPDGQARTDASARAGRRTEDMWAALDRGDDPTVRER